ncbi:MAG TPA: carboxypeptidase-like regulatory domain-containing protein, partial [Pyrinomonadaceae bacterium]|nr:carboxypeptidase-like regulatory domain-containing protein [Pyrinomonadaceae bacterium]
MNKFAPRVLRLKRRACCGLLALTFILLAASARVVAQDDAERRDDAITGQVMDGGGQPIDRAMVYARRLGSMSGATARSAMTDASGQFKISKLPPGVYSLWCSSPGYVNNFSNQAGRPGKPNYYHPGDAATLTLIKGGVISGRATDADGDPIVNASVRLLRVRDVEGRPANNTGGYNAWMFATDDRGMYRIYGVEPGVYVVSVGGSGQEIYGRNSLYDEDAPTFHPSATRDAATEVLVREGQEANGIDIRHRGERGRAVRGVITGAISGGSDWEAVTVTLKNAANGTDETFTYVNTAPGERSLRFELVGVPDGEYEIIAARGGWRAPDVVSSPPIKVSIKGADVTGLTLNLVPLASIGGRVIFEPLPSRPTKTDATPEAERGAQPDCRPGRMPSPVEVALTARRNDAGASSLRNSQSRVNSDEAPNERADFVLRNLDAGRYRL